MDCPAAQERILESLAGTESGAGTPDLEVHLADCEACRTFSEIQTMLDLRLSAAICPPPLSAAFRTSLTKRLRGERLSNWSDFLPGATHLAGGVCATALCLWLLPFSTSTVMLAGLEFTVLTYFVQAAAQSSIEDWTEDSADS